MASVFPYTNGTATTDAFSDPLSTSPLNSPSHSSLHTDVNTAVETIETILQSGGGSRNLLYNGAMQVAQRGTSQASITGGGYYTIDRYRANITGASGTWTQSQTADAPTGSGFRNCLRMLCTATKSPLDANSEVAIVQRLEGQDLQAIRKGTTLAQTLTASFWVKANKTGTYICELYDYNNSRQVSKSYTISVADTWQFVTIAFPADTTGAFTNDANLSLHLCWFLSAGSNLTAGTLNTSWASAVTANRAPGQVNLADTLNNYWQITGVQLNVGSVAAPFEFKSYGQELRECQRYYWQWDFGSGTSYAQVASGHNSGTSSVLCTVRLPVVMRAIPNPIGFSAANTFYVDRAVGGGTATAIAASRATNVAFLIDATLAGGTSGQGAGVTQDASDTAYITASAEL